MPTSPLHKEMDYVSFDILLKGTPLKGIYDILSIESLQQINSIPSAVFTILLPFDPGAADIFAASESKDFIPGTEVEIKLGYESKTDSIFKGVIVRHGIKSKAGERPQLILYCQDKAAKMAVNKKIQAFEDKSDADIIKKVISDHGLDKEVDSTNFKHQQQLQTGITDWDFIATRAKVNGMITYAEAG
ncbi:MAG: hypothetical protein AAGF89_11155, partial [Bacteroidota bacterium]